MAATDPDLKKQSVIDALNNPQYLWRTFSGINKDTGLPLEEVIAIIDEMRAAGIVIPLDSPAQDGTYVFSTRDRINANMGFLEKIRNALRNRII